METASTANFSFVYLPFNTIPDNEVSVSDGDIKDYYESHKHQYKQEESRSLEYVVFNIEPSEKDDQNAIDYVEQNKACLCKG